MEDADKLRFQQEKLRWLQLCDQLQRQHGIENLEIPVCLIQSC
jgi:hypothetical protein